MPGRKEKKAAPSPPAPVLQPRPARLESNTSADSIASQQTDWAADLDAGSTEDMTEFSPDDMYTQFASLLKTSQPQTPPTQTRSTDATSTSKPRLSGHPALQRPAARRPRDVAETEDELDMAAAMDEPLPDERAQMNEQGRFVTGAFLQDQMREEREAEILRRLASTSRPPRDAALETPTEPTLTREDMLRALGPRLDAARPLHRAAPAQADSASAVPPTQPSDASPDAAGTPPQISGVQAPRRVTQRPGASVPEEDRLAAAMERVLKEELEAEAQLKRKKAAQPRPKPVKAAVSAPGKQQSTSRKVSSSQGTSSEGDSNDASTAPLAAAEDVQPAADASSDKAALDESLLKRPKPAARPKVETKAAGRMEYRPEFTQMRGLAKTMMDAQTIFHGKVVQADSGGVVLLSEEHGLLGYVRHKDLSGYNQQRLSACRKSLAHERGVAASSANVRRIREDAMAMLLGATLRVKVSEISEKGFLLFSERDAYRLNAGNQGSYHPAIIEELLRNIGMKLTVRVTALTAFGAFVAFDSEDLKISAPHDPALVTAMVHSSQISWDPRRLHPADMLSVDQEVVAKVTSVDGQKGHVAMSIKQAADDPLLQTVDSLAGKVSVGSSQVDLAQLPGHVSQFLNRLSSIKGIRSIELDQVVEGPAQAPGLQVWLGKEEMDANPQTQKAAIRFGSRIAVVRIMSDLGRLDVREILRGLSS